MMGYVRVNGGRNGRRSHAIHASAMQMRDESRAASGDRREGEGNRDGNQGLQPDSNYDSDPDSIRQPQCPDLVLLEAQQTHKPQKPLELGRHELAWHLH